MESADPWLAIGSPFAIVATVTAGILSATGRHAVVEHVSYQDSCRPTAGEAPATAAAAW